MALELNENNFENEVLKSTQPVLVDFWAPWCGPCRSMAPVIDELASEYEGKAKICKLNVDNNRTLANKYGIMSIPTLVIFKDGKEIEKMIGFTAKGVMSKKLDQLI